MFKGIYIEIMEFLEYFSNFAGDVDIILIPSLPHYAWDRAYTNGFIQPDNTLCEKLRYSYRRVSDIVYSANQAAQIKLSSNLPEGEREQLVKNMMVYIITTSKALIPILEEIKNELETKYNISPDEVNKIRDELKERVTSYMRATSSGKEVK